MIISVWQLEGLKVNQFNLIVYLGMEDYACIPWTLLDLAGQVFALCSSSLQIVARGRGIPYIVSFSMDGRTKENKRSMAPIVPTRHRLQSSNVHKDNL